MTIDSSISFSQTNLEYKEVIGSPFSNSVAQVLLGKCAGSGAGLSRFPSHHTLVVGRCTNDFTSLCLNFLTSVLSANDTFLRMLRELD